MFLNKETGVIVTQLEHMKFAGWLANQWGNARIDRPNLPFSSFVAGVRAHDRGFNGHDTQNVLEMDPFLREQVLRAGFFNRCQDKVEWLIIMNHIRRLLTYNTEAHYYDSFKGQADQIIAKQTAESGYLPRDFQVADRITDACDSISFLASFTTPGHDRIPIFPRLTSDQTTNLFIKVTSTDQIILTPWPLRKDFYHYQLHGFNPQTGQQIPILFDLHQITI